MVLGLSILLMELDHYHVFACILLIISSTSSSVISSNCGGLFDTGLYLGWSFKSSCILLIFDIKRLQIPLWVHHWFYYLVVDFVLLVQLVHLPDYIVSLYLFHNLLPCCWLFQLLLFLVVSILILPWWMLILYFQFCIFCRSSPFFSWTAYTPSPHLWTMVLICKHSVALSELELLHQGPWIVPYQTVPLNHLDHHHRWNSPCVGCWCPWAYDMIEPSLLYVVI